MSPFFRRRPRFFRRRIADGNTATLSAEIDFRPIFAAILRRLFPLGMSRFAQKKMDNLTYYSKMQLLKDGDIKQVRQRRIQSWKISSAEIWSWSLESKRKRFKIHFLLSNLDLEIQLIIEKKIFSHWQFDDVFPCYHASNHRWFKLKHPIFYRR